MNSIKMFFYKLKLVWKYPIELEGLLKEARAEKIRAEEFLKKDNLQLCLRHKDREPSSHYSKHNCDYCKLLGRIHAAIDTNNINILSGYKRNGK